MGVLLLKLLSIITWQVERARQQNEEMLNRKTVDRSSLDRTLQTLSDENQDLQKQLKALQSDLARAEHEHQQRSHLIFLGLFICISRQP